MISETRWAPGRRGADAEGGAKCRELTSPPCVCQVKEMSLIRNTIMECQVCGEWQTRGGLQVGSVPPTPWPGPPVP